MADISSTVATALRLSAAASQMLGDEICRNVDGAKAELIRMGVPTAMVGSAEEYPGVVQAVVMYCLAMMGREGLYDNRMGAFRAMADNLRKSSAPGTVDGDPDAQ